MFLLTLERECNQSGIPLTDAVARQLAAYPSVTFEEETHSSWEFKPRPDQAQKTPPPAWPVRR